MARGSVCITTMREDEKKQKKFLRSSIPYCFFFNYYFFSMTKDSKNVVI